MRTITSVGTTDGLTFVPRLHVQRPTGFSPAYIGSLVAMGKIRTQALPGQLPRYCLEDALEVARAEKRPAVIAS